MQPPFAIMTFPALISPCASVSLIPKDASSSTISRMREIVEELASLGIKETLAHGDINAGNVIIAKGGCIFLDWAEAWISHPFISYEYLAELLRKLRPNEPEWLDELRFSYLRPWRDAYRDAILERTLALSRAVAAPVYTPC